MRVLVVEAERLMADAIAVGLPVQLGELAGSVLDAH
jgi:hypothetical protein